MKTALIVRLIKAVHDITEVKILKEMLLKKLIDKLHYSEYSASQTADDLLRIRHIDIKKALNRWFYNDEMPLVTEDTFSTDKLMHEFDMTYPASLVFIDWYREDPIVAISAVSSRM